MRRRLHACGAGLALALALLWSGAALAQSPSTGNPKGSIAPSTEGSTANPPANPARTLAPGSSGARDSGKAPPEDRRQQPQAGTSTGAGTGDPSRRDRQDKAAVPMPPPRKPADDTKR